MRTSAAIQVGAEEGATLDTITRTYRLPTELHARIVEYLQAEAAKLPTGAKLSENGAVVQLLERALDAAPAKPRRPKP